MIESKSNGTAKHRKIIMRISSVRWERFDKKPILTCTKFCIPNGVLAEIYLQLTYRSFVFSPPFSIGRTNTLEKLYRSAYHPRFVPLLNNAPSSSLYDPELSDFQRKGNSDFWWRQNTVNKYNFHETCIHLIRMAVLCTKMFAVLMSAALRRDPTSNDTKSTMNFTHDAAVAVEWEKSPWWDHMERVSVLPSASHSILAISNLHISHHTLVLGKRHGHLARTTIAKKLNRINQSTNMYNEKSRKSCTLAQWDFWTLSVSQVNCLRCVLCLSQCSISSPSSFFKLVRVNQAIFVLPQEILPLLSGISSAPSKTTSTNEPYSAWMVPNWSVRDNVWLLISMPKILWKCL